MNAYVSKALLRTPFTDFDLMHDWRRVAPAD